MNSDSTAADNAHDPIAQYLALVCAMQQGNYSCTPFASPDTPIGQLGVELGKLAKILERKCAEVDRLQRMMQEVSSGLMVGDVLDRMYDNFRAIIPYNRMSYALLSEDGHVLTQTWFRSDSDEVRLHCGYSASITDGSLQTILETGQPRILNDLEAYLVDHPESHSTRLMVQEGMHSNFTCPLSIQGRRIGFMFFTSREKNTYQHIHQEIFLQIAGQVSIMVEKQCLYQRLRESEEEHYKTMLRSAMDGFWLVNAHGRFLDVNSAYCELSGYRRDELLNMSVSDMEAVESQEEINRHIQEVIATGSDRFETQHRCKDGRIMDVEVSTNYCHLDGGRFFSFLRDITARKRSDEEICLKALLLDSVNDSVIMVDLGGNIVFANDTACITRGYTRQEMLNMTLHELNTPEYADQVKTRIAGLLGCGSTVFESAQIRKDGSRFPIEVSARVVESAGRKFILSVARDITERKLAEEHAHQANHDSLTGLPNRRQLFDRIERALMQAKRHGRLMGVMFMDIDYFKQINDTLGHDTGDQVLIAVAQKIVQCVREQDTVSRLGGDEFVVLLSEISHARDAQAVAEKIFTALAQPFVIGGQALNLAVSVGICLCAKNSVDAQELVANADAAMYVAKRAGRGCLRFHHNEG